MGCVGVVGFVLKMLEDVPNHCRILNVGNHFDVTATACSGQVEPDTFLRELS